MARLNLLSAALAAAVLLVTPAMARESHLASRHRVAETNASITPGARYIGREDGVRDSRFSESFASGG
jgi:hypothetical protein